MPASDSQRPLTPNLPTYDALRGYVSALHRVSATVYDDFQHRVTNLSGTYNERLDWSDPDTWIPQILEGMEIKLARRIWERSNHQLIPRYVEGPWFFGRTHGLIEEDQDHFFRVTDRGRAFLDGDPETVAEIDKYEGLLVVLAIIAARGPSKRDTQYPDWEAFCLTYTGYRKPKSIAWALRSRLTNLRERGLVRRAGYFYTITEAGAAYLEAESDRLEYIPGPTPGTPA